MYYIFFVFNVQSLKTFLFFYFYSIVPTQNDFPYPPVFLHLACNSLKIASFIYYCFPLQI